MKITLKSLAGATALFGIYTIATLAQGYIMTRKHEPDFEAGWADVENLPKETAFGKKPSPFFPVALFCGMVLLCRELVNMKNNQ